MSNNHREDRPAARELHPFVYAAFVGIVSWLVLAIWGFAGDGYADYLLAIVSAFIILFFVALPLTLWRMARRHQDRADGNGTSFRDWAAGEFETWQGRVKGSGAAVEVLLPMAAIAVGMTAFAIVLHFTAT
jgi:hypothetical protein